MKLEKKMLSKTQIDRYHKDGFVVPDFKMPENIINKIVDGKVKKYLSEVTLINQNWVLEPSLTLAQVLKDFNSNNNDDLSIIDFKLFILGEGIEVEEKSFSEEVASQVNNTT